MGRVLKIVGTETITTEFLTHDGKTYRITLSYGSDANIPANAELEVREIEQGTDEFFEYYNKALKEAGLVVSNDNYDVNTLPTEGVEVHEVVPFMPEARFFDISIIGNAGEIEPDAPVEVKIEYLDGIAIGENDKVSGIHFTSDEVQLRDADISENGKEVTVTHTQDSFSVTGDVVISEQGNLEEDAELSNTAVFPSLRAVGENNGPQTTKTVTDNGDGTYKIKLDILGEVEQQEEITKANVIVILDLSGSMSEYSGNTTRLAAAKSAVNNIATTLLSKNNKDGRTGTNDDDVVEMALISFNATATTNISSTTTLSTYTSAVNRLTVPSTSSPQAGTNWEDALQEAANVTFNNDGDPTYVIFVSDGEPTFRNTNGGYNRYVNYNYKRYDEWRAYNQLGVYGYGSESLPETINRCYAQAVDDAQAIVASGREFYTIGAFGTVANMRSLTTAAGAPESHYFSASSSADLAAALNEIADAITNSLGYSNVTTTDGVTSLSTVDADIVDGQVTNFTYYKNNQIWSDAPKAKYENNSVSWDLSSENPLEDGTTYSIEFDIWPSQEAYDTVANLNNHLISFDDVDQSQFIEHADGTYSLRTNTSLTTAYTKNGVSDVDTWDEGESAMSLDARNITIRKIWNNPVDSHIAGGDSSDDFSDGVQLYLTKDGTNYLDGDNAIVVKPTSPGSREWTADREIFVSCGLLTLNTQTHEYDIKEDGHDYSIAEPASFSYYWDLNADIYHPMVINGHAHLLIRDDSATGTDGDDYFVIKGHKYIYSDGNNELRATNDRRSNLNLSKAINDKSDDQGADKNTSFEYTITVNNSNVERGSASNLKSDYYVWFSVWDPVANTTVKDLTTSATAEVGNTGYFYAPSGTPITVELKEGWGLRFINLPVDTTYNIVESSKEGWECEKIEGSATNYETDPSSTETYSPDSDVNAATVEGSIPKSNRSYSVTYTNKWEPDKELVVNKTWADTNGFVTRHGDINIALFKIVDGTETYIEGSVRTIEAPDTTVTYNVSSLGNDVVVREVTVSTEINGEGDEAVTTTNVTPVAANGLIAIEGETTTLDTTGGATDTYIVTYGQGTASDTTRTDTITNTMPQLVVNKNGTGSDRLADAVFKLTGEDGETALTGYGTITSNDNENGNLLNGIYLSNGTYYLVETDAPAGYNKLTYKVKLEVSANTSVITAATEPSSVTNISDETTENKLLYTFTIHNSNGVELPHTGGSGTLPYTLGGIALIMASALMYGFRMRRRERRLN